MEFKYKYNNDQTNTYPVDKAYQYIEGGTDESIQFSSVHNLARMLLIDYSDLDEGENVVCIAKFEVMRELISEFILLTDGEILLNYVELTNNNNDTYLLTLTLNGGIVVRKLDNDENDYYIADMLYIEDTCGHKFLDHNENRELVWSAAFTIGLDYNDGYTPDWFYLDSYASCNGDCANCEAYAYEDGCHENCGRDCENCEDEMINECIHSDEDYDFSDYNCEEEYDEDLSGFTMSCNDDNGYVSYSFYSTDADSVEEMKNKFAGLIKADKLG